MVTGLRWAIGRGRTHLGTKGSLHPLILFFKVLFIGKLGLKSYLAIIKSKIFLFLLIIFKINFIKYTTTSNFSIK